MNTQPKEKSVQDNNGLLQVHSIFHTIQGEGPFAGHPAIFIRLAGCNLQCPHCDTDYSSHRNSLSVADILQTVKGMQKTKLVVITGGEPFRQDIAPLAKLLHCSDFNVQIETNGTLAPTSITSLWNACIVCSPKTSNINEQIALSARAFKYVLDADNVADDGLPLTALGHPASPHVARPPKGYTGPIYLQPLDAGNPYSNRRNLEATVESCKKHGYILQLQIHKLIGEQ